MARVLGAYSLPPSLLMYPQQQAAQQYQYQYQAQPGVQPLQQEVQQLKQGVFPQQYRQKIQNSAQTPAAQKTTSSQVASLVEGSPLLCVVVIRIQTDNALQDYGINSVVK